VGQASSLSIENDGQDARRHQIIFFFRHYFREPLYTDSHGQGGTHPWHREINLLTIEKKHIDIGRI
jgi:hypothetical protein